MSAGQGSFMLKGIIFDLDGVLVDSHPAHKKAWQKLLSSLGRHVTETELEFVVEGHKRDEVLRHFLGELSAADAQSYGSLKDSYFREFAHEVRAVPGVLEFVRAAEESGLALAVGTSAGGKRAEEMIKALGLRPYFNAIVTGSDVTRGKPDPAVFNVAAKRLGISPQDLLVCEDAVAGVQAAQGAGMSCLAIAANGRRALLKEAGADWVVEDFSAVDLEQLRQQFVRRTTARAAGSNS